MVAELEKKTFNKQKRLELETNTGFIYMNLYVEYLKKTFDLLRGLSTAKVKQKKTKNRLDIKVIKVHLVCIDFSSFSKFFIFIDCEQSSS